LSVIIDIKEDEVLSHIKGEVNGDGTKDNPYQISKENDFPISLKLRKSEIFLKFTEISFDVFGLIDSKNCSFIRCNFNELGFQRSGDSYIEACDIHVLSLTAGNDCYYKDCKINEIHNSYSSGNLFENCSILNPQALKEGIFEASGFDKIILYIWLFLIVTFLPNIYFSIVIWRDYWALVGNAAVIVGFGLIYWFVKRSAKKDEKRPNIIK
jgi:hypothetical protein